MGRLRAAMTSRYKDRDEDVKIHTPRNLETLNLSFRGERVAKVGTPILLSYCVLRSFRSLGYRCSCVQTTSKRRRPFRITSRQRLLVHSPRSSRSSRFCRSVYLHRHPEAENRTGRWLGSCTLAFGGYVRTC
jgi:hypothetical protein